MATYLNAPFWYKLYEQVSKRQKSKKKFSNVNCKNLEEKNVIFNYKRKKNHIYFYFCENWTILI